MNASDIIRMRNANTQFSYYKKNVLSKQANCYSDSSLDLSGCTPLQYSSYEQKYLLKEGAKDLGGYTPPIVPLPNYSNKLGFYTLSQYQGKQTYQYRFYDGWGPLIESGINTSYSIVYLYLGLGFQYAAFSNGNNVRVQILDSTGIIINTFVFESNNFNGVNAERYGGLWYETLDGAYIFIYIDCLHGTYKTFKTWKNFNGSFGLTGNTFSFILNDNNIYYFYLWPVASEQPYVAYTFYYEAAFPYTPEIMDFVAFATKNSNEYWNNVSLLLADGTFLTYSFSYQYDSIDIGYYGIDNSRLYVQANRGGTYDVYQFKLNATDFKSPTLTSAIPNEFYLIYYQNEDKDMLTSKNNNFGIYIYNDHPYNMPYYNATILTYFENGSSQSNNFDLISSYVGVNSNGFTVFGVDGSSKLYYKNIRSGQAITSNRVSNHIYDPSYGDYVEYSANMNDYYYYEIFSPTNTENHNPTDYEGFVINVATDALVKTFTYNNSAAKESYIVVSSNSFCRSGFDDRNLAYFTPTSNATYTTTIGEGGSYMYASYPDLATGVIFSVNDVSKPNTINILSNGHFNPNCSIGDVNFDYTSFIIFSDNFNMNWSVYSDLLFTNIDSTGYVLSLSNNITSEDGVSYNSPINTSNTALWPMTSGGNVYYITFTKNDGYNNFYDTNLNPYSFVYRTNYYYSWHN